MPVINETSGDGCFFAAVGGAYAGNASAAFINLALTNGHNEIGANGGLCFSA